MSGWTEGEYSLVREARDSERGFLEDLDQSCFRQRAPIILVCCSDWKRRHDIIQHTAALRGYRPDEDPETHALNWHGGVIRLAPNSPTNLIPKTDEMFLQEVVNALRWTKFRDLVMYAHWPCKQATVAGLTVEEVWQASMSGRDRVVERMSGSVTARTFFHADYENLQAGKRSYYLHPRRCVSWLTQARDDTSHPR
ncbi:MAG: hypothetical protein HY435_02360 [Candidatus Liptonbacteria bacterium]|nr:hypothetical protein [Candidatus Liptonbacteria bacterium]